MPSTKQSPLRLFSTSTLFTSLLLFTSRTLAQVGTVLDSSQLPACAYSCPAITNAQLVCVPPSAPTTNQATYQSCFCNSAYLTAFKGTTFTDICNGVCSANDLNLVRTWYTNLCRTGGAVVTPLAQNAAAAATTTAGANTATQTDSSASATTAAAQYHDPGPQGTWIQTHYNWLIFIIIIILAAIAGIFLGRWLKRRHNRRVADMRAQESGMMAEQAAAAIQSNRHPSEMTITPSGVMRNSLKSRDRFSVYSGAGTDIERGGTPSYGHAYGGTSTPVPSMPVGMPASMLTRGSEDGARLKERMSLAHVRDLGVGGDSSSSVPSRRSEGAASPAPVDGGAGETGKRRSTLRKSMR